MIDYAIIEGGIMLHQGIVVPGLVVVLVSIGCGGSETLTGPEFTKQANAVCAKAAKQFTKRTQGYNDYARTVVASQKIKVEGIGSLRPPTKLQAPYERYKAVIERRSQQFKRALALYKTGRNPERAIVQSVELQTREKELASALGVQC